ncbi:hypothetical protein FACS1894182_00060 [Bacteroidia bacterium]|nr:hypothetical protein FACS1894182_00060 [Bacteroidia bacterium]
MSFCACSNDFLDKNPSQVSNKQIENNPEAMLKQLVAGMYYTTFATGTGGTTRQEDFGQKAVDIITDLMTGDMGFSAAPNYAFRGVYNYTYQVRTGINAEIVWNYYYKIIRTANEIIDFTGGDGNMPVEEVKKHCYGQAKAMRACAYFYLVNLYQHPYSDKKDAPGVPVYTTTLKKEYRAQSSVKEIYNLIISDLEEAIVALADFDRGNDKSKINKYVALGLLGYTYLTRGEMDDYAKAAAAAQQVIESSKFPLMTGEEMINSGYRSINLSSWMWGIDCTVENTPGMYSFWGNVDYFTNGNVNRGNVKIIDADLYASIPNTDIRKKQFGSITTNTVGQAPLAPIYKFYDEKRIAGGDAFYTNDLVYMRAEEMVLIKAEALARLGNRAESSKSLKSLISLRDQTATTNLENLNNNDLLETIWFNWRTEMWGEGKTYLAMKRYKKTMHRSSAAGNHCYFAGKDFPYNYERMIFEIPEYEWVNNPKLVQQQ